MPFLIPSERCEREENVQAETYLLLIQSGTVIKDRKEFATAFFSILMLPGKGNRHDIN